MKKRIILKTKNKNYTINIEPESIVKNLQTIINKHDKSVFLIDRKVFYVFKKIKNFKKQNYILINCSEKIKSFKNYAEISQKILKFGINRNTKIIAIGGGSLGDLSGFIASTILRGVDLIHFPTTLLAQVDSSIGGKNGINTTSGKNLVGTFYQPRCVFIDPNILSTLPKREVLSGYAEIVKHSIINDYSFFKWLNKNSKKILKLDNEVLSQAIHKSILIKKKYILSDEEERLKNNYSRAILNFGHTFGHALETYYKYNKKLTHGEAICIGMIVASTISYKLNYLSLSNLNTIKNHFTINKLPISDNKINDPKIYKIIKKDKKNINGKINFILIKKIGSAFIKHNLRLEKLKEILN